MKPLLEEAYLIVKRHRRAHVAAEGALTRPSFADYLDRRLGRDGRRRWFNFFIRPFGARSFAEFWRLWNPVYGYVLVYFVYRPLRDIVPRPLAVMLTFIACGFVLHDVPAWTFALRPLPPGATIAFVFFGALLLISEAVGMDLTGWPIAARAATNLAYIAGCIGAMLFVVLRWVPSR